MKKIALITDAWHPQVNGVVTVVDNLIEQLKKRDFEVVLITPSLFTNIPLFFYPEIRLSFFSRKKIKNILDAERPDYVHIVTEGPLGFAARRYCAKNNKKYTTSYHTHFALYIELRARVKMFAALLYRIVYKYIRYFHRGAVWTMVATESLKTDLEKRGFSHLVIWPLGIDAARFVKNTNAVAPAGLTRPIFMYFGRLAIEKNVEAFLKCDLPGSKLIIGDGPLRKYFENKYMENILYVGYKKGQELVDLISISDVFVMPSRTETFGLVILEAMACGVPVAAYDVMGPRDIITNGADGYFGEDLAENARKCLKLDANKCIEKARRYSWSNSTDKFISHLIQA